MQNFLIMLNYSIFKINKINTLTEKRLCNTINNIVIYVSYLILFYIFKMFISISHLILEYMKNIF